MQRHHSQAESPRLRIHGIAWGDNRVGRKYRALREREKEKVERRERGRKYGRDSECIGGREGSRKGGRHGGRRGEERSRWNGKEWDGMGFIVITG